jgi:hypothetical protein
LPSRGLGGLTGGHATGGPIGWPNGLLKGWKQPGGPNKITVGTVALIPGTTEVLAGGDTHASGNPGTGVVGVVLEYEV